MCAQCGKRKLTFKPTRISTPERSCTSARRHFLTRALYQDVRVRRRELDGKPSSNLRKHSPEPKFMCNICGKILSTRHSLTYHLTGHTGKRPFTCPWYGKSFVLKSILLIHQNIHTGAKPYTCTLCQKLYADPSSLTKHKRLYK